MNNQHRFIASENIKLYFNRSDINRDYEEVSIIASNNHYYGDFFFDNVYMNLLNKQAALILADALIYEKDFSKFPGYDSSFLYFTAIKYKD